MNSTHTTAAPAEQYEYKAEMKQLLHLIVHSLYTHPEVFVRELVSNASDALAKVRHRQLTDTTLLDRDAPLAITLATDTAAGTFSIEDSGIGMTREELIARLGTVASSGTRDFLQKLQESGGKLDSSVIGQFGVGFYAAFMVADEVTVETRHADADSVGLRWQSDGKGTFTIEEIEKPTRGTKIFFTLKDDAKEFSSEYRLKSIIAKYSNFVDFPIFLKATKPPGASNETDEAGTATAEAATPDKPDEPINSVKALWRMSPDAVSADDRDEFYKFIASDYQAPLGHLHLSLEGVVEFKALLFIPDTAPLRPTPSEHDKSVHLYSNKVMIQENCKELLPEYLRFVRGVVDTDDLPLNVSRETAQSSPVMAKINKVLTGKILSLLQDWSASDPTKFDRFFRNFGSMLKLGVNMDYLNRDALLKLLRFESSTKPKGELVSLQDYVSRMKSTQTDIYYLSGEHRDVMATNPNLEYFQKHGVEVLLLTDPVDVVVVPSIYDFEGKSLKSIDKADIDLERLAGQVNPDASPEEQAQQDAENDAKNSADAALHGVILAAFKTALGEKVEDVVASRRLVDSAATLVVGKEGMDVQMEKMMKMLDKDFTGAKKVLEVNMAHPLLQNLARVATAEPQSPLLSQYALHLYESALLVEGNLPSPTLFVRRMWEIMTEATK
jgi:molecular chaperone HtpG